jgi:hypothetical protein
MVMPGVVPAGTPASSWAACKAVVGQARGLRSRGRDGSEAADVYHGQLNIAAGSGNARIGKAVGGAVGGTRVVNLRVQSVEYGGLPQYHGIQRLWVYYHHLANHGWHAYNIDVAGAADGVQLQAADAGAQVVYGGKHPGIIYRVIGLERRQSQL